MNPALKLLLLLTCVGATHPQSPANNPPVPQSANKTESTALLIKQQFGASFTVSSAVQPAVMVADFDGDGVEDVVIIADSKDPLPDSFAFKYSVTDPYYAFFGYGNPQLTAGFGRADPGHNHDLLVIFGAGSDAWHASVPKAKFVIINVPFDSVEIGRLLVKRNKPPIFVIHAQESRIMDSSIYWDAKKKKWKYQPGDTLE